MNPFISWAITLLLAGGYAWHLAGRPNLLQKLKPAESTNEKPAQAKARSQRKQDRKASARDIKAVGETSSSASGNGRQESRSPVAKKRKINGIPQAEAKPDTTIGTSSDRDEETMTAKDFASAMAQARSGTEFAPSSQPGKKNKSFKPLSSPKLSAGGSSTTGGDADDDLSPAVSPQLHPTNAGGVSDMLEAPAGPAGVLRITGEARPPKSAKSTPKSVEPVETKKQRQARKKREEQKALMEEAEKQRIQLRDAQLRGARMAAGTSNEQRSNAFKRPQTNAWATGKENVPQDPTPLYEPLDTFDDKPANGKLVNGKAPDEKPEASGPPPLSIEAVKEAAGISGSGSESTMSWTNVPSEEEQLKQLQEQEYDNTWNTVSNKKQKKGKLGSESEASSSDPVQKHSSAANTTTTTSSSRPQVGAVNSYSALNSGLKDSDWEA